MPEQTRVTAELTALTESLTRPRFHIYCRETHLPGPCNDGVTRTAADTWITPCPVCAAPYGFHDDGPHAEAVSRIPPHLMLPTGTSRREGERKERAAAYEAWKARTT